jgi:hypothetical protein
MVRFASLAPPTAASAGEWAAIRESVLGLAFESGGQGLTIEGISQRAAISEERFGELFRDEQDCLAQVYESNMVGLEELAFEAYNAHDRWREGLRASAYATAYYLREHPREVSFGPAIRALPAGDVVEALYTQVLGRVADLIDAGRQELEDPSSIERDVADAVLGSVTHYIALGLQDRTRNPTVEMVAQLMYIAVAPYLGIEAAEEELRIPPPPAADSRADRVL